MSSLRNRRKAVSLWSVSPSTDETVSLSKGLNFTIAPKINPSEEITSSVESSITILSKLDFGQIRFEINIILHSAKLPFSNISRKENFALENLQWNAKIVIPPAHKSYTIVIVNSSEYTFKVNILLSDSSKNLLPKVPTTKFEH